MTWKSGLYQNEMFMFMFIMKQPKLMAKERKLLYGRLMGVNEAGGWKLVGAYIRARSGTHVCAISRHSFISVVG